VRNAWTIDFKGHFCVLSGAKCQPLTIRDLYSRYVLAVEHAAPPSEAVVRALMVRVFRGQGLPRAILVDNGAPFAGVGALGLSRLSVWWERLGISVRFTRRGKPQDNGAHEQMHRVLKADTAKPPARTLLAQRRRFVQWRRDYNERRPHEALGGRVPAQLYRPSLRRLHTPPALRYAPSWTRVLVERNGYARWQGRTVLIGRAFAGEWIGLKPCAAPSTSGLEVYFGRKLIGALKPTPAKEIRPAQYEGMPRRRSRKVAP
jgi:putative transposase